jgi:3-oxoacyl-[acyl-carrier protein] reductase
MELDLRGKNAIVTGASRGLGRAIALELAREGCDLAVCARGEDDLAQAAEEFEATGVNVFSELTDVTVTREVHEFVETAAATLGGIDILVNNAGILRDGQLVKVKDGEIVGRMEDAQFDAVIAANLKGVFVCGRAVAPVMIRKGWGRILNASSVVGLYGNFGQSNYIATKAGVIGLTKVWARELGPKGITVNAVAPGFIETDMARRNRSAAEWEETAQRIGSRAMMGRIGRPEDIANAVAFLAAPESGWITAQTLAVDGGRMDYIGH